MIPDPDKTKVRRSVAGGAAAARAALAAMTPFKDQIGEWQRAVARLRGAAEHGDELRDSRQAASLLSGTVADELQRLNELVATLPSEVASHSIVADTRRALERLEHSLADVRQGLR